MKQIGSIAHDQVCFDNKPPTLYCEAGVLGSDFLPLSVGTAAVEI